MEQFLYELARMKHRMYHELYKFNPYASTEEECFKRIKYRAKYGQLLDIINMLPLEQSKKLMEIEKEFFSDAPYVCKNLKTT